MLLILAVIRRYVLRNDNGLQHLGIPYIIIYLLGITRNCCILYNKLYIKWHTIAIFCEEIACLQTKRFLIIHIPKIVKIKRNKHT